MSDAAAAAAVGFALGLGSMKGSMHQIRSGTASSEGNVVAHNTAAKREESGAPDTAAARPIARVGRGFYTIHESSEAR